jgi:hypothetical protein
VKVPVLLIIIIPIPALQLLNSLIVTGKKNMTEKIKMILQCPMPKFDFDVITLGHGSGGLLTHRLLQTGVFDILKNDLLDQQHDGASFPLNGNIAFSTDSYVVSPLFFRVAISATLPLMVQ